MGIQFSRVVTGVDADGTSVCYSTGPLPAHTLAMMPGARFYKVWGTEGALHSPVADPQPDNHAFFPRPGGTRFGLLTFPPDPAPDVAPAQPDEASLGAMAEDAEQKFPGLIGVFEPDAPGMHQTVKGATSRMAVAVLPGWSSFADRKRGRSVISEESAHLAGHQHRPGATVPTR